jgi:hypothetical protein
MVLHVEAENRENDIFSGSSEGVSGTASKIIVDFNFLHTLHFFSLWMFLLGDVTTYLTSCVALDIVLV